MGNDESSLKENQEFREKLITIKYPNGDVYQGEMTDGIRCGKGKYTTSKGNWYEGEWKNDKKHGKGTYFYKLTGECYNGSWFKNKKHGTGTYMYKDQSRYTGEWKENKKHGKGTVEYSDMTGWRGSWHKNLRHGEGEAYNPRGETIKERYEYGKRVWKEDKNFTSLGDEGKISSEFKNLTPGHNHSLMEFGEGLLHFMGVELVNPSKWKVKDCVQFLKHLNLTCYQQIFEENEIDGECLLQMKEVDLKGMGIKAKGHRIRLREAIKKLKQMTKDEIRKKLKESELINKKLSSLVHPESSMDQQKLLSYYDKLDIVEEGNASSEGSNHTESSKLINTLSPNGKLSSERNLDRTDGTGDIAINTNNKTHMISPLKLPHLALVHSNSHHIKRRTWSDHDIEIGGHNKAKYYDDNFPPPPKLGAELSCIQEKDLDMMTEMRDDDEILDDENLDQNSVLVQASTSSSSTSSNGTENNSSEPSMPTQQEFYMLDFNEVQDWIELSKKPYWTCYKGRRLNSEVFIKKYRRKGKNKSKTYSKIKSDAKKLSQVCHKHIVLFFGVSITKHYFYLFTEFMKNGSVHDQLHVKKKDFDEKLILKILLSVAKGMAFLHGINSMHGALRSANILISEDWEIKFSDFFGFTGIMEKYHRFKKLKKRKDADTPYWLAPEILRGEKFGKMIDVYAFGILILEMLTSKIPYETWSLEDMINKIGFDEKYEVPYPFTHFSNDLVEIMYECLDRNPENRPSFPDIIQALENTQQLTDKYIIKELNAFFGPHS